LHNERIPDQKQQATLSQETPMSETLQFSFSLDHLIGCWSNSRNSVSSRKACVPDFQSKSRCGIAPERCWN